MITKQKNLIDNQIIDTVKIFDSVIFYCVIPIISITPVQKTTIFDILEDI